MVRMKELREERQISMAEAAKRIGLPYTTYVNYEKGLREPDSEMLIKIAKFYNTSIDYLVGRSDIRATNEMFANAIPLTEVPRIPIIGKIAAGTPILAIENIIGYEHIPGLKNPEEYFCLLVKGDSMINAGIKPGSRVVVHKQNYAEDGQIVVCRINGDEATLKRFKRAGDMVALLPENTAYSPIFVSCKDFETGEAQIIGIAVKVAFDL